MYATRLMWVVLVLCGVAALAAPAAHAQMQRKAVRLLPPADDAPPPLPLALPLSQPPGPDASTPTKRWTLPELVALAEHHPEVASDRLRRSSERADK